MKNNTFCVINKRTLFPYCGNCKSNFYYANIDKAMLATIKDGNFQEYICYDCWIEVLNDE